VPRSGNEGNDAIGPELVRRTARLARLPIADKDVPRLAGQLSRIVALFETIAGSEAGPDSAAPPPVHPSAQVARGDEAAAPADPRLSELAPDLRHGLVAVPLVVDREGRDA
jgi:aspartyl/glutamyl-tRNA(Asn/Gln) amidotransferase C subunit